MHLLDLVPVASASAQSSQWRAGALVGWVPTLVALPDGKAVADELGGRFTAALSRAEIRIAPSASHYTHLTAPVWLADRIADVAVVAS